MTRKAAGLIALAIMGAAIAVYFPSNETPAVHDGLSPMGRYKAGLIDAAVEGLHFGERVTVDRSARRPSGSAAEFVAEGDRLLDQENQPILASGSFAQAILADENRADAYLSLGRALTLLGKSDRAEAAFRTALDLGLEDPTLRWLGRLLWSEHRKGEAVEIWEHSIERFPEDSEVHLRLAAAAYLASDLDTARTRAEDAVAHGATLPVQLQNLVQTGESTMDRAWVRESVGSTPNVGPQVRVDVGGGTFAANETSIAGIRLAGDELVATWNDWRRSPNINPELINMGAAISLDGGATWQDGLVRPPNANQSDVEGDPMTAYDPRTGNLWVGAISFALNGGLYVARKGPGAPNFEPSVQVGQQFFADKCWMAAGPAPGDPDTTGIYIGYNEGLYRSFDLGETWSFSNNGWPNGLGFLPRVASDGTLYVAYWDTFMRMRIVRSDDGGASFGTPVTAATRLDVWSTQDGSRFPGDFRAPSLPALAVDPNDGTLVYIYADTTNVVDGNSNVDLYLTRSTNQGQNWTPPIIINEDANPPGDQFFPWIEIDDTGRIHMVFHDSRNVVQDDFSGFGGDPSGFFDAYYSYSDDGGLSWTESRLTPQSFDSAQDGLDRFNQFLGDYNGLAIAGDSAYPLYLSNQNGDSDTFTHRIDRSGSGLTLSAPVPGQAGVDNTFVVTGAPFGTEVRLAFGFDTGTTPIGACPGLDLEINDAQQIGSATANMAGIAEITVFIPDAASGQTALFQSGFPCELSNAVTFTFP